MSLPTWGEHPPPRGPCGPSLWNVPATGLYLVCFLSYPRVRYWHLMLGKSVACLGEACPHCAAQVPQQWSAYVPAERWDRLPAEPEPASYNGPYKDVKLPTGGTCRARAEAPAGPRDLWVPITCCMPPGGYWNLREHLLLLAGSECDEASPDCHLPWRGYCAELSRPNGQRDGAVHARGLRERRLPERMRQPWDVDAILERIWGKQPRVLPVATVEAADDDRPVTLPFCRAASGGAS